MEENDMEKKEDEEGSINKGKTLEERWQLQVKKRNWRRKTMTVEENEQEQGRK